MKDNELNFNFPQCPAVTLIDSDGDELFTTSNELEWLHIHAQLVTKKLYKDYKVKYKEEIYEFLPDGRFAQPDEDFFPLYEKYSRDILGF